MSRTAIHAACHLCAASLALAEVSVRQDAAAFVLGNQYLERRVEMRPYLRTVCLTNRLSGHRFDVTGGEFLVTLDDDKLRLSASDFRMVGKPKIVGESARQKAVVCALRCAAHKVEVDVRYELGGDDFYTRKRLTIRAGERLVNSVEVERVHLRLDGKLVPVQRFDQKAMPFRMQPWDIRAGRPLYAASELFMGLEYPAGHNVIDDQGVVCLRHYPGRKGPIETRPAVLGVAPNAPCNRVNDWFLRYIDRIRARPVKRSVQWVAYFNVGTSDELCREKMEHAKQTFADRGVHLDCVLMDSGWTHPQSIMGISPKRPNRLAFIKQLAKEKLDAELGLHVITSGVKPMVDKDWLAEQGYDLIRHESRRSGAYCFGDPRVRDEFGKNLVQYVKDYGIAAYKFDWGYFACDRPDHRGHLLGLNYGIEANTDNFIRVLEALRRAKPDIFLFNTGWYSPWWLQWYDAVFSAGADYNFHLRCCPTFSTCSALCTWRDAVVRGNLVQWSPYFPLSSLMHVSPINHWWHAWNARYKERLDRFTDYVIMSYLRGSQMTEVYLNIAALTDQHRDALASVMNWAAANDEVLLAGTRFIGGDPLAGDVYGYAHFAPDGRGLVAVRNPHVEPADFDLALDESSGTPTDAKGLSAKVIYPYHFAFPQRLASGAALSLRLQGHQTLVLKMRPAAQRADTVRLKGNAPPPVVVSDVRADVEGETVVLTFSAAVSDRTTASAIVWADRPGLEASGSMNEEVVSVEAPHVQLEDSKGAARTYDDRIYSQRADYGVSARGEWSMFRIPLARGPNRVCFRVWCPDLSRIPVRLGKKPSGAVARRPVDLHVAGLVQTATQLSGGHLGAESLLALPDTWARQRRDTVHVLPRKAFTLRSDRRARWYEVGIGAKLFLDDDAEVLRLPSQLMGKPALAVSSAGKRRDSRLSLLFDRPTRVVVAFARPDAPARHLPPQPGWTRCCVGQFEASDPALSADLHFRDFPKGKADAFVGRQGAYAVVALLPKPTDLAPPATVEASSVFPGGHEPELATDGSLRTEWWSANGLPQWLLLDLGKPTWLSRIDVTFYHRDRRYYQYVVETSDDKTQWTRAVDASQNKALATTAGVTHGFARRQARYIRITVCGTSETAAHITEVALFDDPLHHPK